uniref:RRM domain-containing protein n=1 Tax=Strigamia maritima TaxID=126957 RepID=T1J994_STRMM
MDRKITKANRSIAGTLELDSRSIYISNLSYSATAGELQNHFQICGSIKRITIPRNKLTNRSRGVAYIEFIEKDSVKIALALNETIIRRRPICVFPKRSNQRKPDVNEPSRRIVTVSEPILTKKRHRDNCDDEDDESELKRIRKNVISVTNLKKEKKIKILDNGNLSVKLRRNNEAKIFDDLVLKFQSLSIEDDVKIDEKSVIRKNGKITGNKWKKLIFKRKDEVAMPKLGNRKKAEVVLKKLYKKNLQLDSETKRELLFGKNTLKSHQLSLQKKK